MCISAHNDSKTFFQSAYLPVFHNYDVISRELKHPDKYYSDLENKFCYYFKKKSKNIVTFNYFYDIIRKNISQLHIFANFDQ